MTNKERKLVKKLSEVMQEVKYIQKTGRNTFHKYTYATESDVAEHVREELAKRCVMMIPNVLESSMREHKNRSGNVEYIIKVRMEFKFIDGETGEEISLHTEGEGQDAGDKAVYKAMTGAQKYALLKVFMIPTGDDPEEDAGVDERNHREEPKKQQPSSQVENPQITAETIGVLKVKAGEIAHLREDKKTILEAFQSVTKRPDFKMEELTTWTEHAGQECLKMFNTWKAHLESKQKEKVAK